MTNQTALALAQTTSSLPDLARYLVQECGFDYFLTGQAQSDDIEKRFGIYRQLSGTNFFISERQLLESEKKIRILNLLKFSKLSAAEIQSEFEQTEENKTTNVTIEATLLLDILEDKDYKTNKTEPGDARAAFYVAGYLSRRIGKNLKCISCKNMCIQEGDLELQFHESEDLSKEEMQVKQEFLQLMDRGGLVKPIQTLCIFHVYKLFLFLKK